MSNATTLLFLLIPILFVAYFLAPLWLNFGDLPPGKSQNKCLRKLDDPQHDPRLKLRPDDSIKIIRVTNAGEFVDRCELTDALYELNWDRDLPEGSFGAEVSPSAIALPKLAVMYIHGWKHDSDPGDTDLKNFSALIQNLRIRHAAKKQVIGIYIGWNAKSPLPGPLENISFWVKKRNADRIAQSAVVTKIVSAVGSIVARAPNRRDQFVAIGHSFGARILFSATAQSLVYGAEQAHPGHPGGEYGLVRGAADAIILLNPAFEASRFSALDDVSRKDERFAATQSPLLISVSTDNDLATKWAFPIGQWLGSARSERETTTLGNYSPYMTHSLAPHNQHSEIAEHSGIADCFNAGGLLLRRLGRNESSRVVHPGNPFIVANTTASVIDGHNGIWEPRFGNWLAELIAALESHNQKINIEK
jgi:hypothetical protein